MKPRPIEEEHLHMLGPPIKVEVGDTVEVVFLNKASRHYSFFPHGVGIDKSQEGSVYYTRDSGKHFNTSLRSIRDMFETFSYGFVVVEVNNASNSNLTSLL
jgi:hypothetical protein